MKQSSDTMPQFVGNLIVFALLLVAAVGTGAGFDVGVGVGVGFDFQQFRKRNRRGGDGGFYLSFGILKNRGIDVLGSFQREIHGVNNFFDIVFNVVRPHDSYGTFTADGWNRDHLDQVDQPAGGPIGG